MDDKTSLAACTTSAGKKLAWPSTAMGALRLLPAFGVVVVEDDDEDIRSCWWFDLISSSCSTRLQIVSSLGCAAFLEAVTRGPTP